MRVCHGFTARFDDPNLVSCGGLAPVLALAERPGLADLVGEQCAGRGYTGVKGLNGLHGVVSTPGCAPVIAGARLRKGSKNSARGAPRFITDTLITARAAGASATLVLRADSAFFQADVIAAVLRQKAAFSITARMLSPVRKAIEAIPADGWT